VFGLPSATAALRSRHCSMEAQLLLAPSMSHGPLRAATVMMPRAMRIFFLGDDLTETCRKATDGEPLRSPRSGLPVYVASGRQLIPARAA
jgi:hypothetical protein